MVDLSKLLLAADAFLKVAAKEKTDPKAEVRNRGECVFPANSRKIKDKKDHFPINSAAQARNALARVHQYKKAPPWYKGTLEELISAVARKVKSKYKGIDVGGKEKKK